MTSKLRLLLDEEIQKPIADAVRSWRALDVEWVNDIHSLKGQEDLIIINYARSKRRIVVTRETHMNEHQYDICTHPGIIIFPSSRGVEKKIKIFSNLMRSGLKDKCKHAVTYLHERSAVFKIRDKNGTRTDIRAQFQGPKQSFPEYMNCQQRNWKPIHNNPLHTKALVRC